MLLTTVVALMSASTLPDGGEAGAPEWIQLLPAGKIETFDGRGPYSVADVEKLLTASLEAADGKLVLDENHSTDATEFGPARALGWIGEMENRDGGIWGKVEWTKFGKELVEGRAYRGVSPVITADSETGRIGLILRAALTNNPNLRGMAALHNSQTHMENDMDFLESLIAALGLEEGASEDDVLAAVKKALEGTSDDTDEALQSFATALGEKVKPEVQSILSAIKAVATAKSLQTGMVTVETFNALQARFVELDKKTSEAHSAQVVDAAIEAGKPGVSTMRSYYIEQHAKDPKGIEAAFAAMPNLTGPSTITPPASIQDGKVVLSAEDHEIIRQTGVDEKDFIKARLAEAKKEGIA